MRISDWSADGCSSDLGLQAFEKVGLVEVYADVKPGVDPAVAGRALDRQIEKLLKEGPTADEVRRVATGQVASRIAGLEKVGGFGGKAVALAEGAIYANDPEFYKRQRSEEHTSELQSLMRISYAVFCLKKKNQRQTQQELRPHKNTNSTNKK